MNSSNNLITKIKKITILKIKIRLWIFFALKLLRNTWVYPFLYKSYWHEFFFQKNIIPIRSNKKIRKNYLSIHVNYGARIGHQLGNYNTALWYAKKFNLIHVHTPFTNKKWEKI